MKLTTCLLYCLKQLAYLNVYSSTKQVLFFIYDNYENEKN